MNPLERDDEIARSSAWEPPPGAGMERRLLAAYDREFSSRRITRHPVFRLGIPVAACATIAMLLFVRQPREDTSAAQFRPVAQPTFINLTQGEHP